MTYYVIEVYDGSTTVPKNLDKRNPESAIKTAYEIADNRTEVENPQPRAPPLPEDYLTGFYVPGQPEKVMVREID